MHLRLKRDAILIADAHSINCDRFYDFLNDLESGKIKTTQLILFGDIFELLFGGIKYFINANAKTIDLLNKISIGTEIIYLEGNHDFNLKKIFPNIQIIPISRQPLKTIYQHKNILLSHGDNYQKQGYKIYTNIIRNRVVLYILNLIDIVSNNAISKKLTKVVPAKERYGKIENFKSMINYRISKYDLKNTNYIIEGHYHQNSSFDFNDIRYINLPDFKTSKVYTYISNLIK